MYITGSRAVDGDCANTNALFYEAFICIASIDQFF